jgi:hypothetical protein
MTRFLLIACLLFSFSASWAQTSLDTAINFTVKDVQGNTHSLFQYLEEDKIVILDFFTVTCGPCATYASEISNSYRNFGCNSGNVIVLGINWGANNSQVIDFGTENGAEYPEVSGTEGNGNHVVSDYNVLSYPSVILILPDHSIPEPYIWPPSSTHLDSIISQYGGVTSVCTTSAKDVLLVQHEMKISPNPAKETCTLSWAGIKGINNIRLTSLQGVTLKWWKEGFFSTESSQLQIDLNSVRPGYYLIQLLSGERVIESRALIVY